MRICGVIVLRVAGPWSPITMMIGFGSEFAMMARKVDGRRFEGRTGFPMFAGVQTPVERTAYALVSETGHFPGLYQATKRSGTAPTIS